MFRSLQKNWVVWSRAVTVFAAALAILASAFAMSPEIDHRALSERPAVALVADAGVADGGAARAAGETNCHIGLSCLLVILPASDLVLTRFESTPDFSLVLSYPPSEAADMPFHPPRILSQD